MPATSSPGSASPPTQSEALAVQQGKGKGGGAGAGGRDFSRARQGRPCPPTLSEALLLGVSAYEGQEGQEGLRY